MGSVLQMQWAIKFQFFAGGDYVEVLWMSEHIKKISAASRRIQSTRSRCNKLNQSQFHFLLLQVALCHLPWRGLMSSIHGKAETTVGIKVCCQSWFWNQLSFHCHFHDQSSGGSWLLHTWNMEDSDLSSSGFLIWETSLCKIRISSPPMSSFSEGGWGWAKNEKSWLEIELCLTLQREHL